MPGDRILVKSADPDLMQQNAVSNQGLHFLHKKLKRKYMQFSLPRNFVTGDNVPGLLKKWGHLRKKWGH